jgi:hypothetical protein
MKVTYSISKASSELKAFQFQKKIVALQEELLKMPQADIVTTHTFLPGVYERKIDVPAWTVLTGAAHKTDYKVRLEKGTIAVNIGAEIHILIAPCEFEAKAGSQRVGRVFEEDVIWVDIYDNPDNCTDILALEDRLYVVPECGLGANRVERITMQKEPSWLVG